MTIWVLRGFRGEGEWPLCRCLICFERSTMSGAGIGSGFRTYGLCWLLWWGLKGWKRVWEFPLREPSWGLGWYQGSVLRDHDEIYPCRIKRDDIAQWFMWAQKYWPGFSWVGACFASVLQSKFLSNVQRCSLGKLLTDSLALGSRWCSESQGLS